MLQKHYTHCTLKPNYVFLQSILYLYIYIYLMKHERKNLKRKLKFGVYCPRHSVSPVFCQLGVWWPVIRLLTSMIHNKPITVLIRNMCISVTHTHTESKNEYYTAIVVCNHLCCSNSIDHSHGVMPSELQRCKHRPEIETQKQCRDWNLMSSVWGKT